MELYAKIPKKRRGGEELLTPQEPAGRNGRGSRMEGTAEGLY